MASLKTKIREWAIITRFTVLIMQAFFNILILDHDAGDVFHSPRNSDETTVLDWFASFLIGGLGNWDGEYFLHIAKYGYTYENCLVFFPLFPTVVKVFAKTIGLPVFYLLSTHYGMLFICSCVNFVCFVISAEILYELSRYVLREERLAYYAALLYCINPASIFFTAAYSESLFTLFTFLGMLLYERHSWFSSSLCFALATASRSNGMICCGFLGYKIVKELLNVSERKHMRFFSLTGWTISFIIQKLVIMFVYIFIIIAPFISHQMIAYKIFCINDKKDETLPLEVEEYGDIRGYVMPFHDSPDWCYEQLPLSYSHIQAQYWNVGFLKYYQMKQIPNFLLALPIIICIYFTCYQYTLKNSHYCLWLGLKSIEAVDKKHDLKFGLLNPRCFIYIAHVTTLATFGCLCINIQVLTRMLCSSSPVLYWFAANIILTDKTLIPADVNSTLPIDNTIKANRIETVFNLKKFGRNRMVDHIEQWTRQTILTKLIIVYFLSYLIFGTAMFINFYPFT